LAKNSRDLTKISIKNKILRFEILTDFDKMFVLVNLCQVLSNFGEKWYFQKTLLHKLLKKNAKKRQKKLKTIKKLFEFYKK